MGNIEGFLNNYAFICKISTGVNEKKTLIRALYFIFLVGLADQLRIWFFSRIIQEIQTEFSITSDSMTIKIPIWKYWRIFEQYRAHLQNFDWSNWKKTSIWALYFISLIRLIRIADRLGIWFFSRIPNGILIEKADEFN